MPAKSASDVGVTMPQPSENRIGRKPATKLECWVPSDSSSTSLAAESAQRNETTASIIESSTCWPPRPRSRANSAAVIAWLAYSAVTLSAAVWLQEGGHAVVGSAWFAAKPP